MRVEIIILLLSFLLFYIKVMKINFFSELLHLSLFNYRVEFSLMWFHLTCHQVFDCLLQTKF